MAYNMLVVEDNELTGKVLTSLFKKLGFQVHVLTNGTDALPYLETNDVDVLILDLELPGMTGDQIYEGIRKNPKLNNLAIVPFTAHRDTESPGTLPTNLIWAEYKNTGKIPNIVFKKDRANEDDDKDINNNLVDEVALCLMGQHKPITSQMVDYYLTTRKIKPEDLRNIR